MTTAEEASNVQHGGGWSGILVFKGSYDISPLYSRALKAREAQCYTAVYGDTQTGDIGFHDFDEASDSRDAIAHVTQKFPVRPYSLLIVGDVPLTMHVPSRSTTVALWSQGHCNPGFSRMVEDLVQLNREPALEKSNYARLLRERIFERQTGKYAACLGYFSRHPRIVLATRNMEIYSWIVYYNQVYCYVWSTDPSHMHSVRDSLDSIKQNELFYLEIGLENRSLLVVHPLFWITKFNKVLNAFKGGASKLIITSWARNYILRMAVQRPEYLGVDGGVEQVEGLDRVS